MIGQWDGPHPDEGTIHAWLDGELDADHSARLEGHTAECAACASRVAEARGLVAGASRVVGLLDASPAPLVTVGASGAAGTPPRSGSGSLWRLLRVTPARAAIAAVLVVAVGTLLTQQRVDESAVRPPALPARTGGQSAADTAMARTAAAAPIGTTSQAAPPVTRDSVLASAIARKLEKDQPVRVMERAESAPVPTAAPPSAGYLAKLDNVAAAEVAAGRVAARADVAAMGASVADKASARPAAPAPNGAGCYRLDPAEGVPQGWAGIPLPAELSLSPQPAVAEPGGAMRYSITAMGGAMSIGSWVRVGADSIAVALTGATATTNGLLMVSRAMAGTLSAAPPGAADGGTRPVGDQRSLRAAPSDIGRPIRVALRRIACRS